jgi:hypothetical protein
MGNNSRTLSPPSSPPGPSRSWSGSTSRPPGCRNDLAGARSAPAYLYSAAELINHAADLSAASSVLTHENERRWRIFRERVEQVTPSG